jgi:hypothetical protein
MPLVIICSVAHLALAMVIPSPWWVPDLTLVGLVLAVTRRPSRWWLLSGAAGLLTMVWAVRSTGPIFAGYLLIGWAVRLAGRQWDATDLRIESGLVASASLVLTMGAFWLDDLWSPILLVFMGLRTALTCSMVPLVHHLAARVGRPWQVVG